MTWTLIILLTLGAYAFKVTGLVFLGGRSLPPIFERCLALIPAAVVTALVMKDTFTNGQDLVLDARALGIAVAGIAAWRKAPLIVVIVLGATVTALVRQSSLFRFDERLQLFQVASPNGFHHNISADNFTDWSTQPPRECKFFAPREF